MGYFLEIHISRNLEFEWNLSANAGDAGSIPGSGRSPRGMQPTPVFLPGKSHGQRSPMGYSPWVCTELDMTE